MVRSVMGFQGKRELLAQRAGRYREVGHVQKTIILDEFIAATGDACKDAIRRLSTPVAPSAPIKRPRAPRYGADVRAACTSS